jgi:hypothetical protein
MEGRIRILSFSESGRLRTRSSWTTVISVSRLGERQRRTEPRQRPLRLRPLAAERVRARSAGRMRRASRCCLLLERATARRRRPRRRPPVPPARQRPRAARRPPRRPPRCRPTRRPSRLPSPLPRSLASFLPTAAAAAPRLALNPPSIPCILPTLPSSPASRSSPRPRWQAATSLLLGLRPPSLLTPASRKAPTGTVVSAARTVERRRSVRGRSWTSSEEEKAVETQPHSRSSSQPLCPLRPPLLRRPLCMTTRRTSSMQVRTHAQSAARLLPSALPSPLLTAVCLLPAAV